MRNIFRNRITRRETHLPFSFIVSVVLRVSDEGFFSADISICHLNYFSAYVKRVREIMLSATLDTPSWKRIAL